MQNITLTEEKQFTPAQLQKLFLSVGWADGTLPERLYNALQNSATVITAWDGDRLVGLLRAIDDGELLAYAHYVLVHPDYQGQGIAKALVNRMLEKYKDYLYIQVMPQQKKNAAFYEKFGFQAVTEGVGMQIRKPIL